MDPEIAAHVARRDEVLERIRAILITNLDVRRDPDEIDPDTPLFGSGLGLDSVDAVELVVNVQSAFGVKLGNDAQGRSAMRTLNTLADLVIARGGG